MSRGWEGGSTRAWRNQRAAVLAANQEHNDGRCTLQIPGVCTGLATTGHHVHGKGVSDEVVAACEACNLKVGDPRPHDPEPQPRTKW